MARANGEAVHSERAWVPFHESVRSCTPTRMAGFSGEPIALRVEGHVENGRSVAEFLRKDRRVEWFNLRGVLGKSLSRARAKISRRPRLLFDDLWSAAEHLYLGEICGRSVPAGGTSFSGRSRGI